VGAGLGPRTGGTLLVACGWLGLTRPAPTSLPSPPPHPSCPVHRALASAADPVLDAEVDVLLLAACNNLAITALHSRNVQEAITTIEVCVLVRMPCSAAFWPCTPAPMQATSPLFYVSLAVLWEGVGVTAASDVRACLWHPVRFPYPEYGGGGCGRSCCAGRDPGQPWAPPSQLPLPEPVPVGDPCQQQPGGPAVQTGSATGGGVV
jgi:hypothetical protein